MADLNLLPCPFCGGKADYSCREEGFRAYLSMLCSKCGAESGEVRYRSYDNGLNEDRSGYIPPPERMADAAKLWNRRTPAPEECAGAVLTDALRGLSRGYEGGTCISQDLGGTVTLHYESPQEAEAAFEIIADVIDAENRSLAARAQPAGDAEMPALPSNVKRIVIVGDSLRQGDK